MKTVSYYADNNRTGDLLHVETDGCVVNIWVGLSDKDGRRVTAVEVLPDDERRGGDGYGYIWKTADGAPSAGARLTRSLETGGEWV